MLRLGKLTDYAVVLLGALAREGAGPVAANTLAEKTHLPRPTVAKLLKTLHKAGLINATRGVTGGYSLVRQPADISLVEIIEAIEGPVALTDCVPESSRACEYGGHCAHSGRWSKVNDAVRQALSNVHISDMLP